MSRNSTPLERLTLPNIPNNTPEAFKQLNTFAYEVLNDNTNSLQYISRYIRQSYNTIFLMYCVLFSIGIGTAIASIIKGFMAQNGSETIPSLIFAGLSAASFFTIFITKPLEALEKNACFSSWLVAIMSNYWTQLMYLNDPNTIGADLKDAIKELAVDLSELTDKHTLASSKQDSSVNKGK